MQIDVGIYYRQKKPTIDWFYSQGKENVDYTVSVLSSATMVPCLVLCVWLGEEVGFDDSLIDKINGLIKFYGYTEILNTSENFPIDNIKF